MTEFFNAHEVYIWWLTALSIFTFAGTVIVVPWLIIRMPADYFIQQSRQGLTAVGRPSPVKIIILLAKNVLGVIFIGAGIIMLFIPGQGLLTIGIGVILLDFPGKYTVERWVIRRGPVLRAINRIRRQARRPPLNL